ncbi:hypothetical protein AALP_AAs43016U000300 [Arabis alpina]|uniref:Uncharacterized protein n=1 Tax=Arabis alpina TaxID=50452 RepID=A0A087FYX6_ARAAL|nr:hypothetical protein AALP_AAs43016U000300 [Arabis alpina]
MHDLKKQQQEKNKYFFKYIDDSRAASEMTLKKDRAALQSLCSGQETAKAKEGMKRIKKREEKAKSRAVLKAQKEAEEREKKREKKLRKKER